MAFVWDPEKAAANLIKHKVLFEDAVYVFYDPLRVKRRDDDSSINEERYQTIGMSGKVLFVVYSEEGSEDTRLISARIATAKERRIYHGEDGKVQSSGWERNTP